MTSACGLKHQHVDEGTFLESKIPYPILLLKCEVPQRELQLVIFTSLNPTVSIFPCGRDPQ